MTDPIVIAAGADEAYGVPLGVTLVSAVRRVRPGRRVQVHVLDGGLSTGTRDALLAALERARPGVEARFHRGVEARTRGVKTGKYLSSAAYLRLLIPDLLEGPRALYLDSDLVVQRDLTALWDTPLRQAVGAVQDEGVRSLSDVGLVALGADRGRYFNSGVMVLDLDTWRRQKVADAVFDDLRSNAERYWHKDQDALNVVLGDAWDAVDPRWNVQVPANTYLPGALPTDQAFVLHYTTGSKPWNHVARSARTRRHYRAWYRELRLSGLASAADRIRIHATRLRVAARTLARGRRPR